MQMQTLCRAVEISMTTSHSTSVKMFYRGLTEAFIRSPFCEKVHEGQVKRLATDTQGGWAPRAYYACSCVRSFKMAARKKKSGKRERRFNDAENFG